MNRLGMLFLVLGGLAMHLCADTIITFEGFAPSGSIANVNPQAPYTESGYTFTPTNASSAIFDASYGNASFPGDDTSYLGFAAGNAITVTGTAPFDLNSAWLGPIFFSGGSIAVGTPTSITIQGDLFGGGSVSTTFSGLTSATFENIGFTDLQDFVLTSSVGPNLGIDNIDLSPSEAPEPGSFLLLGGGLILANLLPRRTVLCG